MRYSVESLDNHFWRYKIAWLTFRAILNSLRQQDELEQLECWATRKRLIGVRNHYRRLLVDVENRLLRYRLRSPFIYELAYWWRIAVQQIVGEPHYYQRGSAAKYKLRNYSAG
jgi:hypothetical protein